MENETDLKVQRTVIKVSIVAVITLLLIIPLSMIKGVIWDREDTKDAVTIEVANSYAGHQTVFPPYLVSNMENGMVEYNNPSDPNIKKTHTGKYEFYFQQVDYKADVETEMLHRSIYDVIVYNSKIQISGKMPVHEISVIANSNEFRFKVSDTKGFNNPSQLLFGGKSFDIDRRDGEFVANVAFPDSVKAGDSVDFSITFDLKGTQSIFFIPSKYGNTSLAINSSYPHPSFQGTLLPDYRNVQDDGFEAKWDVSSLNCSNSDEMGVRFVDPANPYQQSMRSAKYGILIIILVFVAGLVVEFLTKKEINPVQYAVIGLSLVLFYSLLLSFSEFMMFGVAYIIAALMTTGALVFYFRAILKSRSAYMLGGFVALVYMLNYMLLQMETYALLAGSLVLFLLLCVVMYLTADMSKNKELPKPE